MTKAASFISYALVMLVLSVHCYADCTKTGKAYLIGRISYKPTGENDEVKISREVFFDSLERDGYYGGGCRTAVGRNKARRRAREAALDAMVQKYNDKSRPQMEAICKSGWVESRKPEWMRIHSLKVDFCCEGLGCDEAKLKHSRQKFVCDNGRPVSAQPAPPTVTMRPEFDTKRPGSVYRKFVLPQGDYNACLRACAADSKCKAWLYVKPGIEGPKAVCKLKGAVPPAKSDKCCVSGVK